MQAGLLKRTAKASAHTLTNQVLEKRMGGRMELIENGISERKSMRHRFDK